MKDYIAKRYRADARLWGYGRVARPLLLLTLVATVLTIAAWG